MHQNASRRKFLALAAVAATVGSTVALTSTTAHAEQGNMDAALEDLRSALASLNAATPNKGGHKETATQFVKQAIEQVEAGIAWAAEHGNG